MPTLSLVIIAFNEAERIEACIASVAGLTDEVLVVDSGSKDETVRLAEKAGARVVHRPFTSHIDQKKLGLAAEPR